MSKQIKIPEIILFKHIIIFLITFGALIIVFSFLSTGNISTISTGIGTSIVAGAITMLISSVYYTRQKKNNVLYEEWGLSTIYHARSEINAVTNKYLDKYGEKLDIISLGLRSFQDAKGDTIKKRVKKGLKIRIITLRPDSIFLNFRENEESTAKGELVNSINRLQDWVLDLQKSAKYNDQVQVKFYNSILQDFYFRIDNKLFTGPVAETVLWTQV